METQPLNLDELADRVAGRVFDKLVPHLTAVAVPSDPDALLTENQAATLLSLQPGTLASWRCRGGGPKFIKAGTGQQKAAIRYRRGDVVAWAEERRYSNTSNCIGTAGDGNA